MRLLQAVIVYQNKKGSGKSRDPWPKILRRSPFPPHFHHPPVHSFAFSISLISSSNCSKMDKRTAESPMDFEWQSRAPGDVTSPFYQLSMQHDNQKKRA